MPPGTTSDYDVRPLNGSEVCVHILLVNIILKNSLKISAHATDSSHRCNGTPFRIWAPYQNFSELIEPTDSKLIHYVGLIKMYKHTSFYPVTSPDLHSIQVLVCASSSSRAAALFNYFFKM